MRAAINKHNGLPWEKKLMKNRPGAGFSCTKLSLGGLTPIFSYYTTKLFPLKCSKASKNCTFDPIKALRALTANSPLPWSSLDYTVSQD